MIFSIRLFGIPKSGFGYVQSSMQEPLVLIDEVCVCTKHYIQNALNETKMILGKNNFHLYAMKTLTKGISNSST